MGEAHERCKMVQTRLQDRLLQAESLKKELDWLHSEIAAAQTELHRECAAPSTLIAVHNSAATNETRGQRDHRDGKTVPAMCDHESRLDILMIGRPRHEHEASRHSVPPVHGCSAGIGRNGSGPDASGDRHDGLGARMCELLHGVRKQDGCR